MTIAGLLAAAALLYFFWWSDNRPGAKERKESLRKFGYEEGWFGLRRPRK